MKWQPVAYVAVAVAVAVLTSLWIGEQIGKSNTFDPLIVSTRHVTDRPGSSGTGAQVQPGADVHIEAATCNKSHEAVTTIGTKQWDSIGPAAGTHVEASAHLINTIPPATKAGPSCVISHIVDPMPAEVIARTKQLYAQGLSQVQWQISGTLTPEHKGAVVRSYVSDPFTILPT